VRSRAIGVTLIFPARIATTSVPSSASAIAAGPADPVTGIAVGVEALDELIAVGPLPKTHLDAGDPLARQCGDVHVGGASRARIRGLGIDLHLQRSGDRWTVVLTDETTLAEFHSAR
jgi:hypothetical protein